MSEFKGSVKKVFAGSMESFRDFPVTIGFALALTLVAIVRIQLDWEQQEVVDFLLDCLSWSFAFGAIFSMMATTWSHSRVNTKRAFIIANIVSIVVTVFTFVVLYLFGEAEPFFFKSQYKVLSSLAVARVSVVMLVSYLIFIVLTGLPSGGKSQAKASEKSNYLKIFNVNFAKAFFMNHKALFISLIYGVVIAGGASGVLGAIQALLYQDMSSKVYLYILPITGFIVFTVFVGYFPDFRKGVEDQQREVAESQPRFVEVLFGYIMVPLMLMLSIVLLLWIGQTIITGADVRFVTLSSIAASYTIVGIWLYIMVTDHTSALTKFYRRFYPIVALVILVFEARALVIQLNTSGLKLTEYWFILIWILAAVSSIALIIFKARSYVFIVAMTCILAVFSILPFVGYHALPVNAQLNRLEGLLESEDMFENNTIVAAEVEPELEVREKITDAVTYLGKVNDAKLPDWFDRDLSNAHNFKEAFGFEMAWPMDDPKQPSPDNTGLSLYLPAMPIDVSEYTWSIDPQHQYEHDFHYIPVEGERGTYQIHLINETNIPVLEIYLNDELIIQQDMQDFVDGILDKYSSGDLEPRPGALEDMTMVLETEEIKVLLIFRNIDVTIYSQNDNDYYGVNLESIYMVEKGE